MLRAAGDNLRECCGVDVHAKPLRNFGSSGRKEYISAREKLDVGRGSRVVTGWIGIGALLGIAALVGLIAGLAGLVAGLLGIVVGLVGLVVGLVEIVAGLLEIAACLVEIAADFACLLGGKMVAFLLGGEMVACLLLRGEMVTCLLETFACLLVGRVPVVGFVGLGSATVSRLGAFWRGEGGNWTSGRFFDSDLLGVAFRLVFKFC